MWHGIKPKDGFFSDPTAAVVCYGNGFMGLMQSKVPEWMRGLLPNFGNGIIGKCNIDYDEPIKYVDVLYKLSILINSNPDPKSIVIGGYS